MFNLTKSGILIIILSIIQVFLSYNVFILGETYYKNRIKNGKTNPKVFDISYKYLPDLSDSLLLEYIIDLMLIVPILLFLFLNTKSSLTAEYTTSLLVIQLLRSIFIHSTILPKSKECNTREYTFYNIIFGHCYDKIFSGHLSTSIITGIFLYLSGIVQTPFIPVVYNIIIGLLLLLNRAHYSVDLLVACLAAYSVYTFDKSVLFT